MNTMKIYYYFLFQSSHAVHRIYEGSDAPPLNKREGVWHLIGNTLTNSSNSVESLLKQNISNIQSKYPLHFLSQPTKGTTTPIASTERLKISTSVGSKNSSELKTTFEKQSTFVTKLRTIIPESSSVTSNIESSTVLNKVTSDYKDKTTQYSSSTKKLKPTTKSSMAVSRSSSDSSSARKTLDVPSQNLAVTATSAFTSHVANIQSTTAEHQSLEAKINSPTTETQSFTTKRSLTKIIILPSTTTSSSAMTQTSSATLTKNVKSTKHKEQSRTSIHTGAASASNVSESLKFVTSNVQVPTSKGNEMLSHTMETEATTGTENNLYTKPYISPTSTHSPSTKVSFARSSKMPEVTATKTMLKPTVIVSSTEQSESIIPTFYTSTTLSEIQNTTNLSNDYVVTNPGPTNETQFSLENTTLSLTRNITLPSAETSTNELPIDSSPSQTSEPMTSTNMSTNSTGSAQVTEISSIPLMMYKDDDDTYWPIAMAVTIAVPTIIVVGVAITVIHKKRLASFSRHSRFVRPHFAWS